MLANNKINTALAILTWIIFIENMYKPWNMFQAICLCVWKLEWTRLAYEVRNWGKNFWILCSLHLQQGSINLVNANFFNNKFYIITDIIIGNSCRKKWLKHWLNIKFSLEINHFFFRVVCSFIVLTSTYWLCHEIRISEVVYVFEILFMKTH